jgi:hypothetical protein
VTGEEEKGLVPPEHQIVLSWSLCDPSLRHCPVLEGARGAWWTWCKRVKWWLCETGRYRMKCEGLLSFYEDWNETWTTRK